MITGQPGPKRECTPPFTCKPALPAPAREAIQVYNESRLTGDEKANGFTAAEMPFPIFSRLNTTDPQRYATFNLVSFSSIDQKKASAGYVQLLMLVGTRALAQGPGLMFISIPKQSTIQLCSEITP